MGERIILVIYIKMAPRKTQSRRHRRRCSKAYRKRTIKGGAGAADYAASVYGGIGQQHAANSYSNVIAMKGGEAVPLEATSTLSPGLVGGGKRRGKKGGNGLLTNLAVPAVLLIANQAMTKRRRSTSNKRRSHRRR